MVDFNRALEVLRWKSEISRTVEQERDPNRARLMEALMEHVPRTYHDYRRAYALFMEVAFADHLQTRQRAATELERVQPRGFGLIPPSAVPLPQPSPGGHDDMKTGQMFPSKYLKADELPDGYCVDVQLVDFRIENVGGDDQGQGGEAKPVVYFGGFGKGLILNRTNADKLTELTGSDDSDHWLNGVFALYKTKTRFGTRVVNAIRIEARGYRPGPQVPQGAPAFPQGIPQQHPGTAAYVPGPEAYAPQPAPTVVPQSMVPQVPPMAPSQQVPNPAVPPAPPVPPQDPAKTQPGSGPAVTQGPQTRAEGWVPDDDDVPF